ncbi:MAG: hypothetical protein IJP70_09060 [Bacteroidales bacterium]|nr:hypothetical protein [Bacteroidales bacterium]
MRNLTAAIQFGSSRICAAAAWVDDKGQHEVAAIESVSSAGCISHGCVVGIDDTAVRIKSLMQKLSNRVKSFGANNLNTAYVGLCGISMHSMEYQPTSLMGEEGMPSEEMVQHLAAKSLNLNISGHDILGLHNNGETVDGQHITAHHQLIVAERRLKQGLQAAMERAHIRIAGWMATPLIEADILTPEEKEKGVLLVNLGAQLTSLSIWKDTQLKFLTVIPLGCHAVTRDIATRGLRLEEAEELKASWSDASRPSEDNSSMPTVPTPIPIKDLNLIVASRYEEIVANIASQVNQTGFKGQLEAGCVLTGGGSVQKGLTALFSKRLDVTRINTRSCNTLRYASSERKPYLTSLMTMLNLCQVSCEETNTFVEEKKPAPIATTTPVTPKPTMEERKKESKNDLFAGRRKSAAKSVRGFFGDLFSGLDE